jgi:uncharacterized SAM-binding protein YcdF (DUF218 family)
MPQPSRSSPLAIILRVLVGSVVLVVLAWGVSLAMVVWWARRDRARPAEAIVVLGAAQYAGRPSPVLQARLDHALELWRRGLAPHFILTGGVGTGDTQSEAAVGRRYVMRHGVPDSAIMLESHGRTTNESLAAVADLLARRPSRKVILVSDPFHMLRLSITARRYGLVPYTSPTRTSPISASESEWHYFINESLKAPYSMIFERNLQ